MICSSRLVKRLGLRLSLHYLEIHYLRFHNNEINNY